MITAAIVDPLIEHPWLARTAFVLCLTVGPVLGYILMQRRGLAAVLSGVSSLPILALTLVPVDRELSGRCSVDWLLPTFARVELLANVVLFIPPVLLAAIATRRPVVALMGGSVTAGAIEAIQAAVPALGRSCDTNDWLSNTIGAALGAGLAALVLWAEARRRMRRTPDAFMSDVVPRSENAVGASDTTPDASGGCGV
ncbi:MAG: VanZ family protein [Acidimicrobiales bacterium]